MKTIKKILLSSLLAIAIIIPIQITNINAISKTTKGAVLKTYVVVETSEQYGMKQHYIKTLCPVNFNWYDNGIPAEVMTKNASGMYSFIPDKVVDTGYGIVDSGLYFRKIGAKLNSGKTVYFWARTDNLVQMVYW